MDLDAAVATSVTSVTTSSVVAPEAMALKEAVAPKVVDPQAVASKAGAPKVLAPKEALAPKALAPQAGATKAGAPKAINQVHLSYFMIRICLIMINHVI